MIFEVIESDLAAQEALGASVSRETYDRFSIYVELLKRWQKMINLVAPSTLEHAWLRHVLDSSQIFDLAPDARVWVDLGSGAGFPGLITAIHLTHLGAGNVSLIESDKRKCAFLREVIRETGARADVFNARIEDAVPKLTSDVEIVSARALASLGALLQLSDSLMVKGARALFLKGKDVNRELTEVPRLDRYAYRLWSSQSQLEGSIVDISLKPENS